MAHQPLPLSVEEFETAANIAGTLVLDVREKGIFSKGFIPGSVFIGLEGDFTYWAKQVLPGPAIKLLLIVPEPQVGKATQLLMEAGFNNIVGYLSGGFEAWKNTGKPVEEVPTLDVPGFAADYQSGRVAHVLDVRRQDEYDDRHIRQAQLLPLEELRDRISEADPLKPYHLHCRSGYRSTIAASMLKARGSAPVVNLHGMIDDVFDAGVPHNE
ncbi:MAG: rhodanese-like domain-containing protein [Phaeodactylibacter sp.]|uniref:rhodanese-like domain-containing protein n=1 Tax=Phaeodactylibacter sp. TaxID=1940289 RepID=UPI0032ED5F46